MEAAQTSTRGSESSYIEPQQSLIGGSNVSPVPPPPAVQTIGDDMIRRPSYGSYAGRTGERTPVKMAVMRKTDAEGGAVKKPRRRSSQEQQNKRQISTNQEQQQHHQAMGVIRVCSDCNTTKTPLWRSGPRGPKSLCNACGIRQRKARRAAMAAAAAVHVPGLRKEKRPDAAQPLPFKKRCKMAAGHHVDAPKNALLGDSPVNASKSGVACARAPLPEQDEITDAAILLMALSCGLVRS